MKKNYIFILLMTLCLTGVSFGQTPIITMIADGDCSGGTPKVLEIYASGTIDFTLFSIENQTNANTTWGNTQSLADFGTVTDGFVYVVADADLTIFNAEFPSLDNAKIIASNALSINGDDRVRIIKDSDSSVIDQYGLEGTDGSSTNWEYKDGYAKRSNGTSDNGGTFNESNWVFSNGSLNGNGSCQGGATFGSIISVGTFTNATASLKNNVIEGFATYPNPVTNKEFTISSRSTSVKEVAIFNVIGKKVLVTNFSGINATINVSAISAGIYILKVMEAGKIATKKLVIR